MFYGKELDATIFCSLQRVIHFVNPYFDDFKSCKRKLEETENTYLTMRMVIKMADPTKPN